VASAAACPQPLAQTAEEKIHRDLKTFVLQDGSANPSDHHLVEWVIALPGYNRFSVVRLNPALIRGKGRVVAM